MNNLVSFQKIFMMFFFLLGLIICCSMLSSEIILHISEPLDLSKASVEDIENKKLVNATITDTLGMFMYEDRSYNYYYLIPMDNGKYIIFCTGDKEQKNLLNTYIDSTYNYNPAPLSIEIRGRISHLSTKEKRVFFDSLVENGFLRSDAEEYVIPYKIENDNGMLSWIYLILAVVALLAFFGTLISFIKEIQSKKNYIAIAAEPTGGIEYYTGYDQNDIGYGYNQENNGSNGGEHQYTDCGQNNPGEQYTGYGQGNNNGGKPGQGSQSNNSESNIHKF